MNAFSGRFTYSASPFFGRGASSSAFAVDRRRLAAGGRAGERERERAEEPSARTGERPPREDAGEEKTGEQSDAGDTGDIGDGLRASGGVCRRRVGLRWCTTGYSRDAGESKGEGAGGKVNARGVAEVKAMAGACGAVVTSSAVAANTRCEHRCPTDRTLRSTLMVECRMGRYLRREWLRCAGMAI
jgi:hypothetical protein